MRTILLAVLLAFLASVAAAVAHESRPAYLEITETAPNRYAVLWRTPLLSGMPLPVVLRFPAEVRNVTNPNERAFADSIVERRTIAVDGGLLALAESGDLVRFDASPDGYKERARASVLTKPTRAAPALADGRLYARDGSRLVCVKLK